MTRDGARNDDGATAPSIRAGYVGACRWRAQRVRAMRPRPSPGAGHKSIDLLVYEAALGGRGVPLPEHPVRAEALASTLTVN